MNNNVKEYVDKFPDEVKELYHQLRNIIYDSAPQEVEEKLWAKLPSYYVGDSFIRLIQFKDHINIEAHAIVFHKEELNGYRITSKGMLQLYISQSVPVDVLKRVFSDTLCDEANNDRRIKFQMKILRYDSFPSYAKEIRETVFIQEQGFQSEFDEIDNTAVHFVLFDEDEIPIATCRVFWNEKMDSYTLA